MIEYYVLKRDDEFQIVSVTKGNDPLYGHESWSMHAGPFETVEHAENSCPKDDEK